MELIASAYACIDVGINIRVIMSIDDRIDNSGGHEVSTGQNSFNIICRSSSHSHRYQHHRVIAKNIDHLHRHRVAARHLVAMVRAG